MQRDYFGAILRREVKLEIEIVECKKIKCAEREYKALVMDIAVRKKRREDALRELK